MSDDHAERAISAYDSDLIQTPNIDRIANEGVRFSNSFVTNSICAPSRAVLLTGKYSHLNGLRDNRDEFDGSQLTFPKLLQASGYQTAVVGKWHLKTEPTGFDYWKVLIGQGEYYSPEFREAGKTVQHTGYVTDLITDFALQFLDSRDTQKPFCLLLHHKAPHRNWMPNVKHLGMFSDEDLPLPATLYDDYEGRQAAAQQDMRIADMYLSMDMKLHRKYYRKETGTGGNKNFEPGDSWVSSYNRMTEEQKKAWDAHYEPINQAFLNGNLKGKELIEWKYQRYMKDYLRTIVSVDENIGRVLDYLDQTDLAKNTLVVYTSDQGFYLGEHGWYDKRFMYEESLSMPLVEEFQGRSLRPSLVGQTPADWRDALYYHYYEYPHGWHDVKQHYGVRTDRHKLIHFYHDIDTWEMYDLQSDPYELNNLYGEAEFSSVQQDLHRRLEDLQMEFKDPISEQ
jgi:arylsulfatase A-like enzyme